MQHLPKRLSIRFPSLFLGSAQALCLILATCILPVAIADHMNGVYVGQDNAGGARLTIQQTGTKISGTIVASNLKIDFQGTTDGQDNANCEASVQENGQLSTGFLQMSLQRKSLKLSINIKNNTKYNGDYLFVRDTGDRPPKTENQPTTETQRPPAEEQPVESSNGALGGLPNFD